MPALSDCQQPFLVVFWLEELDGIWTPAMPPCRCSNGRDLLQGLEIRDLERLRRSLRVVVEASTGYHGKRKTLVISVNLLKRNAGSTCLRTGQSHHDLRHGPQEELVKTAAWSPSRAGRGDSGTGDGQSPRVLRAKTQLSRLPEPFLCIAAECALRPWQGPTADSDLGGLKYGKKSQHQPSEA